MPGRTNKQNKQSLKQNNNIQQNNKQYKTTTEANYCHLPVFDEGKMSLCTGSMWLISTGVTSMGCDPFRVSKSASWPFWQPPTSRCGSLGLYSRHSMCEEGRRAISGLLGFSAERCYSIKHRVQNHTMHVFLYTYIHTCTTCMPSKLFRLVESRKLYVPISQM